MSYELLRALAFAELAPPAALAGALQASIASGTPFIRILIGHGTIERGLLEDFLGRVDGPFLKSVSPVPEVVSTLPPGTCERLLAVPVRRDPRTGTIDVAAVDLRDAHVESEMAFLLKAPVRMVRTTLAALDDALSRTTHSRPPTTDRLGFPRLPGGAPPFGAPPNAPLVAETELGGAPESRGPQLSRAERTPKSAPPPPRRQVATPPWGTPKVAVEPRAVPTFRPQRADAPPRGNTQVPPPLEPMVAEQRHRSAPRNHEPPPSSSLAPMRPPVSTLDYVRRPSHVPLSGPGVDVSARSVVSFIPGPPPMRIGSSMATPPVPNADIASVFTAMKMAEDRDLVMELLLSAARVVARRVALFVVKRGGFVGWTCSPEFSDRASLQTVMIPTSIPSVFTTAIAEGSFLGAIRQDEAHASLLRVMRSATRDVAISPVRVNGKTILFVVADELGDTMIGTRRLDELTRAAGDAFARIVRTRR